MIVEQIYTGCLAQGAYYIESEGEAVVIDPLREPSPYLERAARDKAKIKFVLETHFHADFVSGHLDLAAKSGAKIVYGPNAETGFDTHVATDGEILKVGKLSIVVIHTPGHTMESTTYLLRDEEGKDHAIFTGDTLFIGDVGRPDLAQKGASMTQEEMAGHLFDSLRNKLMTLDDDVIVYPAHGAGSPCGKNMSSETSATLGNQKQFNYALRADMTRDEFIQEVTNGLTPPPQYFPKNVMLNKHGYNSFDEVMDRGLNPLNPEEFETLVESREALIIDTRNQPVFIKGFVPGSVFIGLNGNFAPWVGTLVPNIEQPILLVTEVGKEEEAVRRLSRVGYDNCMGFLQGGVDAWKQSGRELDQIEQIPPEALASSFENLDGQVLDVRKPGEYANGHLPGVPLFSLDYINDNMAEIKPDQKYYLHCKSGYRSTVAISILKSRGFHNLVNAGGGFDALSQILPVTTDMPEPQG